MSEIKNKKVTDNFWLYEIIDAHPADSREFKEIVWNNIREFNEKNAEKVLQFLQIKRDYINSKFKDKNGGREIGIKITSGFRPVVWEKKRGRSGLSRHTKSDAADIQPTNCSPELAVEIIQHLYDIDSDRETGHQGGFAIKKPVIVYDKVKLIGFAHYDLRGLPARWWY